MIHDLHEAIHKIVCDNVDENCVCGGIVPMLQQVSFYVFDKTLFLTFIFCAAALVDQDDKFFSMVNYAFDQPRDSALFCFKPIPVSFGPMGEASCGTILYPNSIRDLIDFALRDCVTQNIPVRRCRNCGRYFPIIGRVTAEYCSRPQPSGKFCRNIAPVRKWAEGQKKDLVFQEYRREYKRHFAWIKAGKISEEQFADWAKQAKAKKKECDREEITLDEFKDWLKRS